MLVQQFNELKHMWNTNSPTERPLYIWSIDPI